MMEPAYKISKIYFEQENLVLILNDQKYYFKIIEISDKLAKADEKDRNNFQLSPSGYGIHWPGIDEDLSINGLLNLLQKRHVA
ncbi:MAG: DUF2442 domain-containing protein [Bacteroidetes bacterium]|nr:DUF2442 domain-containing protein [Bacteroidota bacterium]